MTSGDSSDTPLEETALPPAPPRLTDNSRAFRVMVRNEMFRRIELAADDDFEALGALDAEHGWDADRWADALDTYWDEHEFIESGPAARGPALLHITPGTDTWGVRQTVVDPEGNHDWFMAATVDLDASNEAGSAVVLFQEFSRM